MSRQGEEAGPVNGPRSWGVDLALLGATSHEDHQQIRASLDGRVGIWTAEYLRDGYVTAGYFAEAPAPVIGTAVSQSFPRSPVVTALAALDLAALSGGRFVLGLGSGVKRANRQWHGLDIERPVAQLSDYVRAVRAACDALRGGAPRFESEFYSFDLTGRPPVPDGAGTPLIYLAGVQRRMASTAGEFADGLIGHTLHTMAYLEHLREAVGQGAERSGRDAREVATLLYRCCAPSDASPTAERDARRQIAFYAATRTYFTPLEEMGFAQEAKRARACLRTGDGELADTVSDAMMDELAIVGSRTDCVVAIRAYRGSSVDRVLLFPPYLQVDEGSTSGYHQAVLEVAKAAMAPD